MLRASRTEPFYAELHIAKMLYANQWPFRCVKPRGKKGDDYDLEISCDGYTRCGDTKCKLESTVQTTASITSTLKKNRNQLPPYGPGVFFIKIPQTWIDVANWQNIVGQGALDFFAMGTGRVASVVFYLEALRFKDGMLGQTQAWLELINPRHPLANKSDWHLFTQWRPPQTSPDSMPRFWIRLSNFPKGFQDYEES
jgi:hypothetical protein